MRRVVLALSAMGGAVILLVGGHDERTDTLNGGRGNDRIEA